VQFWIETDGFLRSMIWIDIEDLLGFFYAGNRPSGIQRLSFDLCRELVRLGEGRVGVCRHGPGESGFTIVDWPETEARILRATCHTEPVIPDDEPTLEAALPAPPAVSALRSHARRLPLDIRGPLLMGANAEIHAARALADVFRAQVHALRAIRDLLVNIWRWVRPARKPVYAPAYALEVAPDSGADEPPPPMDTALLLDHPVGFAHGDILLSTGATWQFQTYYARIDRLKHSAGVIFAAFAHDMVPILFPEWSVKHTTDAFEIWAREVLPRADILFTNSDATARDVASFARQNGLTIPKAIKLPMGMSFVTQKNLPPPLHPNKFVLFVSTIEPRKNHAAMLRLWRRLLQSLPAVMVPDLVFAGRIGWLARDVIGQAENADWLGGKLRLIEAPSDAELAALYRDCVFTVYPSFYEGWGLPVTESLCFGKPVAASNKGSIPEAGGEFCVYFDPDDLNDAERVVRGLIEHPEQLASLTARIAARFHPPGWDVTAQAALSVLAPARAITDCVA
jgi:glycosyltransferase involved in cell wall biosynthesis